MSIINPIVSPVISKGIFNSIFGYTSDSGFNPNPIDGLQANFLNGKQPYYATSSLSGFELLDPKNNYGTFRAPRQGRAYLFDGANDYGTRGARVTSGEVTQLAACVWVKFSSTGTQTFMGETSTAVSQRSWRIYALSGRIVFFFSRDGGPTYVKDYRTTVTSYNDGQWHHVAFSYSGGQLTCYIDGTEVTPSKITDQTVDSLHNTTEPFVVGAVNTSTTPGNFMIGSLRDVRVFSTSKSAAEIAAIYNGELDTDGLLAQYPCNEEAGTVGYDISGNGNHLTLTNITTSTFHGTDADVRYNYNNEFGYRLSSGVYIPALISGLSAADGNELTVTGQCPYPMTVETPCITGDGTAAYVDLGSALIPATADFDVEFGYHHLNPGFGFRSIIGQRTDTSDRFLLYMSASTGSGNAPVLLIGSIILFTSTISLAPGVDYRIKITRVGNVWSLFIDGVLAGSDSLSQSIGGDQNTALLATLSGSGSAFSTSRVYDLRITTGGVTTYFPLQDGAGSSNTNRDLSYIKSDGTYGVVSNAIVNGTVANIWANRCAGYAQDWCVNYGGSIAANGAFSPGQISGSLAADGSTKTLEPGKFGNPYSRLNINPFSAAEYNGRSIPTAYEVGDDLNGTVTPTDSAFRRTAADGDDRFTIFKNTLTGSDLTNMEGYTS